MTTPNAKPPQELYDSGAGEKAARLLAKARKTNQKRDADDRKGGFGAPGDSGTAGHLRTAITALVAGLQSEDWSAVAEGCCMVQEVEYLLRKNFDDEASLMAADAIRTAAGRLADILCHAADKLDPKTREKKEGS